MKYAFCNDKWLVLSASGEPSVFSPNLNDVPYPPGDSSGTYRTLALKSGQWVRNKDDLHTETCASRPTNRRRSGEPA